MNRLPRLMGTMNYALLRKRPTASVDVRSKYPKKTFGYYGKERGFFFLEGFGPCFFASCLLAFGKRLGKGNLHTKFHQNLFT